MLDRRRALRLLGGAALAGVTAACSSSSSTSTSSSSPSGSPTSARDREQPTARPEPGAETPDEMAGPFPADGTNGPDVLGEDGVVRSDLTTSFGPFAAAAAGVPITFRLSVVDAVSGDALRGAAVYAWHCTADGRYSVYEIADQNFLRGVQVAGGDGNVVFESVFPGCYAGRWPHLHFEVFPGPADTAGGRPSMKTSQLALPVEPCRAVYADRRYGESAARLDELSLDGDVVFADGWREQLATVEGSVNDGFVASLLVRV